MPERLCHFAHLRQMRHQLGGGLVHVLDRRAGEFELAARLERNGAAVGDVEQADDVVALHDRLPAEQVVHAFEQRADRAAAGIGHRPVILDREGEFLVLGADAELFRRLAARFEPGDEFVARLDRGHVDLVTGHEVFRRKKVATLNMVRRKGQCEDDERSQRLRDRRVVSAALCADGSENRNDTTNSRREFIFCSFAPRGHALLVFASMPQFSPHQDQALKAVAHWLKEKPGVNGNARQVFRLFGYAGTGKTTLARHLAEHVDGEVKFAAFTGKAASRDARQGLPRRLHHPRPDLPRARERRGNPLLRPVGRGARLQGRADHHRRMLDGGCRARPRPVVVRRAGAGAGRSGATAADPGRRIFHRGRARRHAHRSAPAGRGRSDHPPVDGPFAPASISSPAAMARPKWWRATISIPNACWKPTRCWSGATPRGAPTTSGCASGAASTTPCRRPATSWCACATTARRACSTAGFGR